MRLTQWTDYTLRVLMYCAACQERDTPVTITEIADAYVISRSHLTKVVFALSGLGWLSTTRGRGGGLRLARPADEFSLEEIVRTTETDFTMVECFDAKTNRCGLTAHCVLKGVLQEAMDSYMAVLRRTTLADLVRPPQSPTASSQRILLTPGIPLSWPAIPKARASAQSSPSSAPRPSRARKKQP